MLLNPAGSSQSFFLTCCPQHLTVDFSLQKHLLHLVSTGSSAASLATPAAAFASLSFPSWDSDLGKLLSTFKPWSPLPVLMAFNDIYYTMIPKPVFPAIPLPWTLAACLCSLLSTSPRVCNGHLMPSLSHTSQACFSCRLLHLHFHFSYSSPSKLITPPNSWGQKSAVNCDCFLSLTYHISSVSKHFSSPSWEYSV